MNYKTACLLIFSFAFSLFLKGQSLSSPFIVRTYTTHDGLPLNYVSFIRQDSLGYLWVGTRYGYSRFDGQRFSFITGKGEIKNFPIGRLIEDDSGRLMLLSTDALYYLDTKTKISLEKKGWYFPVITSPGKKSHGKTEFWTILKDSVYCLNKNNTPKKIPNLGVGDDLCRQIFETDSGWYYNYMHKLLFVKKNGEIKNIGLLLPKKTGFIVLMGYRNNRFYLYTNRGIYTYSNNKIRSLFEKQLSHKHIYSAYCDKKNRMWVATAEEGVLISEPGQEETLSYTIKVPHNLINDFCEDKEGNIWIAGLEGLTKVQEANFETFPPGSYPFLSDLNLVAKDKEGRIFLFSETNGFSTCYHGIFSFNKNNPLQRQLIDAICLDDRNRFWCISRQHRIIILNNKSAKFIDDTILQVSKIFEQDIVYDNYRKKVWVPGENLLSGDEKGFIVYKDSHNNPVKNTKYMVYLGNGKIIASTTNNELLLITPTNNILKVNTPENLFPEKIINLFSDSSDNIWISYPGGGLLQCRLDDDINLQIINKFTSESGLDNDAIQSMTYDKQGRIWLSTMAGIAIIDLKNKTNANIAPVYLFGRDEGMPESGYEYGSLQMDDAGDMWYSTQSLLMKFHVSDMKFENTPPQVNIENVSLLMEQTNWHKYTDSLTGIFQIPYKPVMKYNENSITVFFKAVSMNNNGNIQYSYQVKGLNENWSISSTNNSITLAKLNPGTYTFFVRARKSNSDWSDPASFSFTIRHALWQHWWFNPFLIAVFAGLIYWLFRFRIKQIRKEVNIRRKLAIDLHDDIGSTLSSISYYSEAIKKQVKEISPQVIPLLDKMESASDYTINAMSDIVWTINPAHDKGVNLFNRMHNYAAELCGIRNIELEFDVDKSFQDSKLNMEVRKNLYLIFKEAVNNAVKYSGCNRISIRLGEEEKYILLKIQDNGKGYDVQKKFSGNGLQNMQQRAKEIKGHLEIISGQDKGTCITLKL